MIDVLTTSQPVLDALSTGVVVFVPTRTDSSQWQVAAWNPALEALRGDSCSELLSQEAKRFLETDAKTNAPLCQGKPVAANAMLPIHTALFKTGDAQTIRVKVKYDWLSPETLLAWVEPFSEDMALTQAHADFVSTVSHEFRTPLTSIKGFADTLLRYGGNLDIEQQKRFITIIKHQADRLTRLVENLLTVSKLGAQKAQFIYRPIPIRKTVERIVQSVEGKLSEPRQFKILVADDVPDVWADPDKLEQVLLNLIDNAAKYSYPNTEVRISAETLPDDSDKVCIAIKDQGVGIPQEHLPNIFNKFSRIDNPLTREVEGTGLGLYITKSLATAMGGQLSADSTPGEPGSTFSVTLPIATAERQAAAQLAQDDEGSGT